MSVPPSTGSTGKSLDIAYRGILDRLVTAAKAVVTVGDQIKRLEKEDERSQGQILELTRIVLVLSKEVADMTGQMKGIEGVWKIGRR